MKIPDLGYHSWESYHTHGIFTERMPTAMDRCATAHALRAPRTPAAHTPRTHQSVIAVIRARAAPLLRTYRTFFMRAHRERLLCQYRVGDARSFGVLTALYSAAWPLVFSRIFVRCLLTYLLIPAFAVRAAQQRCIGLVKQRFAFDTIRSRAARHSLDACCCAATVVFYYTGAIPFCYCCRLSFSASNASV